MGIHDRGTTGPRDHGHQTAGGRGEGVGELVAKGEILLLPRADLSACHACLRATHRQAQAGAVALAQEPRGFQVLDPDDGVTHGMGQGAQRMELAAKCVEHSAEYGRLMLDAGGSLGVWVAKCLGG